MSKKSSKLLRTAFTLSQQLATIPGELGSPVLATTVDIVSNGTSYTIPNDGIYGDSLSFTEGSATENVGQNATVSCEMTY